MRVAEFEPRLLKLWQDVSFAPKTVDIPDDDPQPLNKAIAMRQRMYQLRKAMRKEKHPDVSAANRVKIAVEMYDKLSGQWFPFINMDQNTKKHSAKEFTAYRLNFRSFDAELDNILEKAGYAETEAPDLD